MIFIPRVLGGSGTRCWLVGGGWIDSSKRDTADFLSSKFWIACPAAVGELSKRGKKHVV